LVPDISEWTPEQLSKFFAEKEFPPEVYRKFIEQVRINVLTETMA
jgi:hypothetical protein